MKVTDQMIEALWRVLPSEVQECAASDPENIEPWVAAVLAIVERDLPDIGEVARQAYERGQRDLLALQRMGF